MTADRKGNARQAATSRTYVKRTSKSTQPERYPAMNDYANPATVSEHPITNETGIHISVVHDSLDGWTAANISMSDAPSVGRDFTLPELWRLIGDLTTAAEVLELHSPVPYTVVD